MAPEHDRAWPLGEGALSIGAGARLAAGGYGVVRADAAVANG